MPGPVDPGGEPSWTLHDPAAGRFYTLGWLEAAMLRHWSAGRFAALVAAVEHDTGHQISAERIEELVAFLARHHLIRAESPAALAALKTAAEARRQSFQTWLLHNYLFFRLPLLHPDRWLGAWLPLVRPLFSPAFAVFAGVVGLLGLALTVHRWEVFRTTFLYFFSAEGALAYLGVLALAKLFHEFSHAFMAKAHGCRVPTMGIAFMVMWPVLYTDTTEVWALASRRTRLAIGAAGMGAELVLAGFALFLWDFLPPGPARSAAVLMAGTIWLMTLAINLNPFMRFDGYYLLADFLGVDNLQPRAFALARWRLRRLLCGFTEPAPEFFSPRLRRWLVLYAWLTWLYRLVLFLSIALLVYHFVVKLVGILLMAVEVVWFIGRPIRLELLEYWRRRHDLRVNGNTVATVLGLAGLILLAAVPWSGSVTVPAVMVARAHAWLYPPFPARLHSILVAEGRQVAAGEPVAELGAPELEQAIRESETRIAVLRWQIGNRGSRPELLVNSAVLVQELAQRLTEAAGYAAQKAQLTVTAPFAGTVTGVEDSMVAGRWLARTTPLVELTDLSATLIEAFVGEDDLERIAPGTEGRFLPEDTAEPAFAVRVVAVDRMALAALPRPYPASLYGGPIAVREDSAHRLVPDQATYRLTLVPLTPRHGPSRITPGRVRLEVEPEPLINRFATRIVTVLVRESGW
ncbi:MAG: HlyD family efflux transporter periplasmic adaptor subunit [Rhodospirillaceae bacterium]